MNEPERLLTSIKAALGYSSLQTSVDMWEWQILSLMGFIFLGLFLFAVGYIMYSGLTSKIIIKTGLPPVRSITVAYKYRTGAYKDCGSVFRESSSIGPKLSCIGIFYDNPKKVSRLFSEQGYQWKLHMGHFIAMSVSHRYILQHWQENIIIIIVIGLINGIVSGQVYFCPHICGNSDTLPFY